MAASVLNSEKAVQASLYVVRAFVRLRKWVDAHGTILSKIDELEKKYDGQFQVVFETLREMIDKPALPPRKKIGFKQSRK